MHPKLLDKSYHSYAYALRSLSLSLSLFSLSLSPRFSPSLKGTKDGPCGRSSRRAYQSTPPARGRRLVDRTSSSAFRREEQGASPSPSQRLRESSALRATSQSPQSACAPPCHTRARRPLLRHSYRGRFPCGRSRSWQSTSSARCEHTCARGGGGGGGSATGGASDTCVSAC